MATIPPPEDNRESNRILLERFGPSASRLVTRVDTAVEGVHFDLSILSPAEVGHRALAMALSDIAAVGAEPLHVHVTVGARQETSEPFLFELETGYTQLAKRLKVSLDRGGVFPSPTALLIQTVVVAKRGKLDWSPAGGTAGDRLFVTGGLGGALAAMTCLKRLGRPTLRGKEALLQPHTKPEPRVAAAKWLRSLEPKIRPSAVIDLQDGLATEMARLSKASGVGANIDVAKIPVTDATREAAGLVRGTLDVWAVYGPEDYELLVAIPAKQADAFVAAAKKARQAFTEIGELLPKKARVTITNRESERVNLEPRLWHHFVRRAPLRVMD